VLGSQKSVEDSFAPVVDRIDEAIDHAWGANLEHPEAARFLVAHARVEE
jgi:hypothetical protein